MKRVNFLSYCVALFVDNYVGKQIFINMHAPSKLCQEPEKTFSSVVSPSRLKMYIYV